MIAAKQVGAAFVLPNFMTKLVFDAILLVQKLPMPYKVFSNL
jgi:hypothetical protein